MILGIQGIVNILNLKYLLIAFLTIVIKENIFLDIQIHLTQHFIGPELKRDPTQAISILTENKSKFL